MSPYREKLRKYLPTEKRTGSWALGSHVQKSTRCKRMLPRCILSLIRPPLLPDDTEMFENVILIAVHFLDLKKHNDGEYSRSLVLVLFTVEAFSLKLKA